MRTKTSLPHTGPCPQAPAPSLTHTTINSGGLLASMDPTALDLMDMFAPTTSSAHIVAPTVRGEQPLLYIRNSLELLDHTLFHHSTFSIIMTQSRFEYCLVPDNQTTRQHSHNYMRVRTSTMPWKPGLRQHSEPSFQTRCSPSR